MPTSRLRLSREQILGYRRRASHLEERIPYKPDSLRQAAWAGLQDSMPRAALLSIHARVSDVTPTAWQDPTYVQIWGPRFSTYVIATDDLAVFTLSRLPDTEAKREICTSLALRLREALGDARMSASAAAKAIGEHHNQIRRASSTGTILIHWDGAHQPTIWSVPAPQVDPTEARLEMARRYLHVFGPTTGEAFASWAGISKPLGPQTFDALDNELAPVETPVGEAWILSDDVDAFTKTREPGSMVRFLPSGDTYYLVSGARRDLVVPDRDRQDLLWTSRVWPGAVLIDGEIVGTWRRAQHQVTVDLWSKVSRQTRERAEVEASELPLPDLDRDITVTWNQP